MSIEELPPWPVYPEHLSDVEFYENGGHRQYQYDYIKALRARLAFVRAELEAIDWNCGKTLLDFGHDLHPLIAACKEPS